MTNWTLVSLDGHFAVCRLAADAPLPAWAAAGSFVSITRTPDELSIVCRHEDVPDGVRCEPGWRCLRVAGTLDFTLVGVLVSLLAPLADAGIPVFVVSTFDTDYLLIKEDRLDAAVAILRGAGHGVDDRGP
jgi:uncharacterized protein